VNTDGCTRNLREGRDGQNEASSEFWVLSSEFEMTEKSETEESSRIDGQSSKAEG
jgi:hypothetical protein